MAKEHGKYGRVLMSTSAAGGVAAVSMAEWALNLATDQVEVTSFGDSNKTYVTGLKDLQGSFSGFLDTSDQTLFQAADSTDGCKLYLYPDATNNAGKYWYGLANVSASITDPVSGALAITGTFSARGSWTRLWN